MQITVQICHGTTLEFNDKYGGPGERFIPVVCDSSADPAGLRK